MLLLEDSPLFFLKLPLNPHHNQRHNRFHLHLIQSPILLNSMPLLDTTSTTCVCDIQRFEHRISFYRCLFPIILWKIMSNPFIYELKRVLFDCFETFGGNLIPVFLKQFEFGSKFGFSKGGELLRYS